MSKNKKLFLKSSHIEKNFALTQAKTKIKEDPDSYKDSHFDFGFKETAVCQCTDFRECGKDKNTKRDKCFSFYKLTSEEFIDILIKLTEHKSKTWREIETQDSTSTGKMVIEKLEHQIKKMVQSFLENHPEYDTDELYKIEIDGRHRVWGIRRNCLFYPIWNDPQHNFYKPINKNYTFSKK